MADRIAIMNHGVAEQIGPPHGVYEHPANSFVARFLGEANMFRLLHAERAGDARTRCKVEGGLTLLCGGAAAGAMLCIRPENIGIGTTPPARDNCFSGRVMDAVHVAGSVRYRVAIAPGSSVVVRMATGRRVRPPAIDDEVHVGWDAEDMLVLSE
jgi:putative spermidine/putrescine transport system ATP-binding protein